MITRVFAKRLKTLDLWIGFLENIADDFFDGQNSGAQSEHQSTNRCAWASYPLL